MEHMDWMLKLLNYSMQRMVSLHTLPKILGSNADRICLWKSIVDETLKWVLLDFVQLHCLYIAAIHFDKIGEEACIEQWR